MTAIVKKIKVGLSQEEIDELKPFDGTYDGDINANGFISIQNKNITFGGAKSNSVEVSFKNGSRNGNSSEELAFLSDLVGSDVAQSVIDLGTISSSFQSSVCEDLDGLTETGIYTFKYGNTRYMMNVEKVQTGATTYSTFQYIYTKPDVYFTRINNGTSWNYFGAKYLVDSTDSVTSGNTSNKIFLVGRTSQSITGGTAFSHDTVYVDTDGHLYDSGKRVLTTADSVGGDYLPLGGGQMEGSIQVPATGGGISDRNGYNLVGEGASGINLGNNYNTVSITKLKSITAPTSSGGTNYGVGSNGQVLMSNGFTPYWGTVSGEQIVIQETYSNSTYTYTTDFDWSKLTIDNFDDYCIRFLRFNGGNHEILKAEKIFASSIGNTYYYENTVIGVKVVMSSTGTATISTYTPTASNDGTTTSLQSKAFSWTKVTTESSGKLWESIYNEELYELLKNAKYMEFWAVQNNVAYLWYSPVSVMRRKEEGTVNYLNITGSINSVSPLTFDTVTFAFSITQLNSNTSGKKLYLSTTDVWDAIYAFKVYY